MDQFEEERKNIEISNKGRLITAILKELHDSDVFMATTCKFSELNEKNSPDKFTTIRWISDEEDAEETIITHLAYLFNEPWITEAMIFAAILQSHNINSKDIDDE